MVAAKAKMKLIAEATTFAQPSDSFLTSQLNTQKKVANELCK